MSREGLLLLDSNVPMYAAGADHPYRVACQAVLRRAVGGQIEAVTDAEVHQEILYRYLSLRLPEKAREVSEDFERIVPTIFPISASEIALVRRLSTSYPSLPARDLLHVAVMLAHGIQTIVTADHHFDTVAEVTRLDPIQLAGI